MRIESEIKLDFKDVLIRPKKSSLQSRNDVNLRKEMYFKHVNDYSWSGVPIMAANMDTTGTFETAFDLLEADFENVILAFYDNFTNE